MHSHGIRLIVGLGNPGQRYLNTRHNAGFSFAAFVAREYQINFSREIKFQSLMGSFILDGKKCYLILPQTFMNLSGIAVAKVMQYHRLLAENILVVHDELDFAPGVVRLKFGGGANGHHGIESIIDALGGENFWRMRMGIGRPGHGTEVSSYVLGNPSAGDGEQIHHANVAAMAVIPQLLIGDFQGAMGKLHGEK